MTLKTVTGPSIAAALADARRLFGEDVVLLQSSPSVHGQPAAVTVAFDAVPAPAAARPTAPAPAPRPAPPAVPEPLATPAPRAYGYAAVRNARPALPEPISVSPPPPAPAAPAAPRPAPGSPAPQASATSAEVAELRARLAQLEALVAAGTAGAPETAPAPRRAPLVFVGPGGSGKTSLALRLAQAPHLVGATNVAVVIVAPEAERFVDPAPVFWGGGVPVAVVHTADDVREAVQTFADADLLLVDTPSLPLNPKRSRPFVQRLGELLAPLVDVEVHLVVDATRTPDSLTSETVAALGIRPDALALTRLDEASREAWRWGGHLDCPIQLISAGPDLEGLCTEASLTPTPAARPAAPAAADVPAVARPAAPEVSPYSDDEIEAYFLSSNRSAAPAPTPSSAPGGSAVSAADRAALFADVSATVRPVGVLA